MTVRLGLTRPQIVAFRRHAGELDERLPSGPDSLRRAAWAGLQDSMPRAAVLSIHARVQGTVPATWEDPSLVQLRGPRFNVFVVAARDLAVFSLGTLPDDVKGLQRAEDLAARLAAALGDKRMAYAEAGRALGVHHNSLRYAAALRETLTPARTPAGDAWILAQDEEAFRAGLRVAAPARLLPSGDSFLLLQGADRELMVPDGDRRRALWTPRVWPGGLLLAGELAGTWRRSDTALTVQPWRQLSGAERDAVVAEAEALPLPRAGRRIVVRWASGPG